MNEHQIQSAAIKEIRKISGCEWTFAIPNARKCNVIQGKYLKSEGRLAGVWDVFIPCPDFKFNGIWIEFKSGKNKLTHEQCLFGLAMSNREYALSICRSAQDAIDAVIDYKEGKGKKHTESSIAEINKIIEKTNLSPKSPAINPLD